NSSSGTAVTGPSQGFLLEVLLLSVPALGYIVFLIATGQDHFVSSNGTDTALLIGCGPVTAVPLLLFAFGAKLLRLSTIGIMQYIAPTMVFLIAVLIFDEPFGTTQAIAFALIWAALAIYSWSMLATARRATSVRAV
ncbi:MAG: EamA family transporter RarD, partial [Mesorhizobium sp.]